MGYDTELYYAAAQSLRKFYVDPDVSLLTPTQVIIILQFINTKTGKPPKIVIRDKEMLWFIITTGMSLPTSHPYFPIAAMFYVNIAFDRREDQHLGLLYGGMDLAEMYRTRWRYRLPDARFD
jgi:hypothetical protein